MRKARTYRIEFRVVMNQSILVKDCRSKAEALRKAKLNQDVEPNFSEPMNNIWHNATIEPWDCDDKEKDGL